MAFSRRKNYDPSGEEAHRISRSKIDLFVQCARCFYLDQRHGIKRPEFPAFTLNSAVDTLLKKEFDIHRAKKEPHPLMKAYKIDAVPAEHPELEKWRHNFTGIKYHHEPTNLEIFGAIDDIWVGKKGEHHIVDYKATAKEKDPDLEGPYQVGYKRQMDIYQWLFRMNGFKISDVGYFVYVNGKKDRKAFDGKLEFDVFIIPYKGDDSWVEGTIFDIKKCLTGGLPEPSQDCEYCLYRKNAALVAMQSTGHKSKKEEKGDKDEEQNSTLF